jgi:parvulin-like peptidyl-prolyl isomerase
MAKQPSTPRVVTKKHLARVERERRQTRLILGIAIAGILIVLGLLGFGFFRYNVVADVNGEKITAAQWQERVKFQRVQMINIYNQYAFYQQNFGFDYSQQMQQVATQLQSPETIGQEVLDVMIDEILIRQAAREGGITVSPEEVEASIRENFNFFPDGTPTPTITPTEVTLPTLSSQQLTLYPSTSTPTEAPTSTAEPTATRDRSATPTATATQAPPTPTPVPEVATASPTPFTLEGFQTQYKQTLENFKTYGVSETTIRAVYEAQLYRQKLMDEITKDVPHTEEQVWARHILVETPEVAKVVSERLKNGEDFAALAKELSKDTGSGANGGDLGWFGRGAMVAEFEETAFKLGIGEISDPVQSQFGYHIIQALGHQEVPLNASQYQQKKETEFTNWLATRRSEGSVTTYDIWKERVPTEPSLQAIQ